MFFLGITILLVSGSVFTNKHILIVCLTNHYEAANGNLLSSIYGNNHTINFNYDEFDRIKTVTKMNNTYHYKYDNLGNLVKIISNDGEEKYVYDLAKRLNEYKVNHYKINYKYDINNNITNKTYQLGTNINIIKNTYNEDDAITKIIYNDTHEIKYDYDYLGRLKEKTMNDNYKTKYKYITNGKKHP